MWVERDLFRLAVILPENVLHFTEMFVWVC